MNILLTFCLLLLASASASLGKDCSDKAPESGKASWYGPAWHGRKTANGERYNMESFTAAHRHLPFGTLVRVTRLGQNKSTVVRINNRGPYCRGRIIDLSKAAARQLGMLKSGVARVRLEVISGSTSTFALASHAQIP